MNDGGAALRWKMRRHRSRRALPHAPPPQFDADEYAAAKALILLANSAGGFYAAKIATAPMNSPIFSPNKLHQEVPQSAAAIANKQQATSPDTPLPPPFHHCWLCGKVFESSQALGGHMTSHRAKIITNAEERERIHECSFCHQTFPTGQALGGHKRRHYDGPLIAKKAPKSETSTSPKRIAGEITSAAAGHVRPIIDLNLPPPPEFDEF